MKKIYFLFFTLCFFNCVVAQNIDPDFNQFKLPINNYFVDGTVIKSKVLSDNKILLLSKYNQLVRLDGNLLDTGFNLGTGFSNGNETAALNDFFIQPDGKILVTGRFNSFNGENVSDIIRLNANGTLDATFKFQGISLIGGGIQIELQADGKIILVAEQTMNTGKFDNLIRLNADGSYDKSFITVPDFHFDKVAIQPDGKIIVVHNTNNEFYSDYNYVARLNTDGSFDTSFVKAKFSTLIGSSVYLYKLLILSNGKIIVGGKFTGAGGKSSRNLAQLNNDGTLDTSFAIGLGFNAGFATTSDYVKDVVEQKDHKIVVCGSFKRFDTTDRENLARLNPDGTFDSSFQDVVNFLNINVLSSVSLFTDEKILVSGGVGDYKKQDNFVVKINNDGSKDNSFNNIGKGFYNVRVSTVVQTKAGKILVGGDFHSYNGSKSHGFIRLNQDGSADNTLTYGGMSGFEGNGTGGNITAICESPDGKIYLGGYFNTFNGAAAGRLVRINADGTKDTTFNTGNGIDYGVSYPGRINDIVVLANGNILVGGSFVTYNGSNAKGIINLSPKGIQLGYPDIGNKVTCFKIQDDGKLLVGLSSTGGGEYSLGTLKRYKDNWVLDTSFILDPLLSGGSVNSIDIQQDGKILLNGTFTVNGAAMSIVRIFSDGSLDNSFSFNIQNKDFIVNDFALLPNQKILVYLFNKTVAESKIMRLNNNGTTDASFDQFSPNGLVNLYSQADGKTLVYGQLLNSKGNPGAGLNRLSGEDYNLVQGSNKIDLDNNGCDSKDAAFANLKMHIASQENSFDYITNTTGTYSASLVNGSHTISPVLENPSYFNVTPKTAKINFPTEVSPFKQDFCISPNGVHYDLEITLLPLQPARPGFEGSYKIIYKNKGNKVQSGSAQLIFDKTLTFIKATPEAVSPNSFSWDFIDLKPFEAREITIKLKINAPIDTPAVNNGDVLKLIAVVSSQNKDETPDDNTFTLNQTAVGSYDPNDKTCLEGSVITPGLIGGYVHYLIRFENTGTYPAQNIVVKDMIDLDKFDISTLIPTSSSHPFVTKISEGNKVEFIFENIKLPFDDDHNDGYIAFKIKTKPTLVVGDSFTNEANIYFDYNFPILTNKETSTFKTLGIQDFEFSNYFTVYPVPANDILNIHTTQAIEIESLEIYDILGQLVIAVPNAHSLSGVDISRLRTGNYFIKVKSDKGSSSMKFIKR
ncbi:T9SS C-terminal target domain-containing protein [Flavobacterium cupreum]|uniref:T9SS C-terminal target domain-containing protein n=1 Tax=Flavobacterium cupreum TaxID=2133766 RepID=A0A434A174_9FLAO|nr:T9SS type A sorting domain-containing protein [Flavobacterium cupreum]RUT68113.1 T9SS C-terminal target domain-containing protein [Flavobacterium cupreum]